MKAVLLALSVIIGLVVVTSLPLGFVHTPIGPLPSHCVHTVGNDDFIYEDKHGALLIKDKKTDILKKK